MTTFHKIELVFLSALMGWCFAMAALPRCPEPVEPYCPTREECWHVATSFAGIAVEQAVHTCVYSTEEREYHEHIRDVNDALQDDYDAECQFRIDELYDAMATAELQQGFEPWYPEDQLLCGCLSAEIKNDDVCTKALLDICNEPAP